jgi:hypothetical protein
MAVKSREYLIKKVVEEIHNDSRNLNLDPHRSFHVFIHSPKLPREFGFGTDQIGLEVAVEKLLKMMDTEPTYVGQILYYRPIRRIVYEKLPE